MPWASIVGAIATTVIGGMMADDGGGGRPLTRLPSSGLGLLGMQERVNADGGTLHVGPRSRGGFVVRATVPVGAA